MSDENLLDVDGLSVDYVDAAGAAHHAVADVSFHLRKGEILGVVGESGSGKTTLMLSLLRLLPTNGRIISGQVNFLGQNLLNLSERRMQQVRGQQIGMIFQGAINGLNPVHTIERQIGETMWRHGVVSGKTAVAARVVELLELVGLDPRRSQNYPHQLSGGMRQRVTIAMALAGNPQIILADEPTTALDVILQAQILDLLQSLRDSLKVSILLVTHDLGVVAEICDSVLVMYGGIPTEYAPVDELFNQPRHPYTKQLLKTFSNMQHLTSKHPARHHLLETTHD